jgi:hypothetical protein
METEIFVTGGKIRERHAAARKAPLRRPDSFTPFTEHRREGFKERIAQDHMSSVIDFAFFLHRMFLAAVGIIFSMTFPGLLAKRGGEAAVQFFM